MFAPLVSLLKKIGPGYYRHIHWECGLIGQILYVQATLMGRHVSATGMGCFVDADINSLFFPSSHLQEEETKDSIPLLNMETNTYQSLYHFAIGFSGSNDWDERYPPYDYKRHILDVLSETSA